MKNALTFMFKDKNFKKVFGIYFIFAYFMHLFTNLTNIFENQQNITNSPIQFFIFGILAVLLSFFTTGYWCSCIKTFSELKENISLPFMNFKKNFISGLKFQIGILLFTLTTAIIFIITMFGFKLLENAGQETLYAILFLGLILLFLLVIFIYMISWSYIFADTNWITSFFRFKRATILIKENLKSYIINTLILFFVLMISGIINLILIEFAGNDIIKISALTLIMALISSYTVYVSSYIIAKAIKQENKE